MLEPNAITSWVLSLMSGLANDYNNQQFSTKSILVVYALGIMSGLTLFSGFGLGFVTGCLVGAVSTICLGIDNFRGTRKLRDERIIVKKRGNRVLSWPGWGMSDR